MKKGNRPLIVAVFLVIGGLASATSVIQNGTHAAEVVSTHRSGEFFIPTAQGAENAATLFSMRTLSPITAVSSDNTQGQRLVFSAAQGAVKDPGTQGSSRSR